MTVSATALADDPRIAPSLRRLAYLASTPGEWRGIRDHLLILAERLEEPDLGEIQIAGDIRDVAKKEPYQGYVRGQVHLEIPLCPGDPDPEGRPGFVVGERTIFAFFTLFPERRRPGTTRWVGVLDVPDGPIVRVRLPTRTGQDCHAAQAEDREFAWALLAAQTAAHYLGARLFRRRPSYFSAGLRDGRRRAGPTR